MGVVKFYFNPRLLDRLREDLTAGLYIGLQWDEHYIKAFYKL